MEVEVSKPRLSYAEFIASKPAGVTLVALINRYIEEMEGIKPLGESHRCTLRKVGRMPIGAKVASALTKHDFIDMAKALKADGLCPATVNQYCTYTGGVLKYAPSAWDEHKEVSHLALELAKPFLKSHGYIGKSTPRDRRPTPEEIDKLVAFFTKQNEQKRTRIDMVKMTLWQVRSARRVGESCALLWEDWSREDHTIVVRKMKDPRNKNKRKVVALPKAAQAMLEELWPARDPNEPRIFPYKSKSCTKRYIDAKHRTGINGLRLHDSRRECGTRLVEDDGYTPAQAILVTGHETVAIFERTYLRQDARKFKDGPRAIR